MAAIEASVVLFDFGGVVLRTPFELLDDGWRGPFDPDADELWQQSMAGQITERDYWHQRAVTIYPDAANPTMTLFRDLYERDEDALIWPEMTALIDLLDAAGFRVAVLTNDLTKFHPQAWVERITTLDRFEHVIDLSHAGVLKPEPEAFDLAVATLQAPADEVVFVDDQPGNVDGARAVGMTAVWFDPTDVATSVQRIMATVELTEPPNG